VAFYDFTELDNLLENAAEVTSIDKQCVAFQIVVNQISELRVTTACTNSLLNREVVPRVSSVLTAVITSTVPPVGGMGRKSSLKELQFSRKSSQ